MSSDMQLPWRDLGLILDVRERSSWMRSHAQNPNALVLKDRIRVFFTCRPERSADGQSTSVIAWADLDREDPRRVLAVAKQPVMGLGGPGTFDEFGTMPGSIVGDGDRLRLYYVGWSRSAPTPYRWAIGLAFSDDGGITFHRHSAGPLLATSADDPYLAACPRVFLDGTGGWIMDYQSGLGWTEDHGHWESCYQSRRARSADGIVWQRDSGLLLAPVVDRECQTSTSIFSDLSGAARFAMAFSWRPGIGFRNRGMGYRIGLARSDDGESWQRCDAAMRWVSPEAQWCDDMRCYPHVIKVDGRILMFHCGNAFGQAGFGAAELLA